MLFPLTSFDWYKMYYHYNTSVKIIKNEVGYKAGCRDDTVPKTIEMKSTKVQTLGANNYLAGRGAVARARGSEKAHALTNM